MPRARLTPPVLALLFTATLGLAGCGAEPGDAAPRATPTASSGSTGSTGSTDERPTRSTEDGATTTHPTAEDPDLTPMEQTMVDAAVETYEQFGLPPEAARCLAEAIIGAQLSGEVVGQLDAMAFITDCEIGLEDLSAMSEALGGTPEEALRRAMQAGLENQGLSEEDATCVVDAYIDEYGPTDQTSFQDLGVQVELFQTCDVTLSGN